MDRPAIFKSIVGAVIAAPFAYVLKGALEAWGVLNPVAEALGGWLKVHVPPATAGWTMAVLISGGLYALLLWKVWRPRHVHHLPITAETRPQATVASKLIKASPAETTETFRYSDHALRDFGEDISLPDSITPAVILADCEGKTELQCEGATAHYLGQRLKVSGQLYAATKFLGAATTVTISLDGVDRATAFLTFEDDRARISVLKPGDRLTATGRIVEVTPSELRLLDCRLL